MFYPTTCVGLRYGPAPRLSLSGFSREHVSARCPLAPGGSRYCRVSAARRICLPDVKPTSLQRAIPSARGVSTSPSPRRPRAGCRNLDRLSIGIAVRLTLRPRLTLIRLALIRNPWSYGGGGSRPPCRYLYLHLLFRCLQRGSRPAFGGCLNAPLPMSPPGGHPTASAAGLCPIIIHAGPLD